MVHVDKLFLPSLGAGVAPHGTAPGPGLWRGIVLVKGEEMDNLAGCELDNGTKVAREELEFAGIDVLELPASMTTSGEVKIKVAGNIDRWGFHRAWYYWVVKGPGLALEYAVPLDEKWGKEARVDGDCACRGAAFWGKGQSINLYHVDTKEGLKALADAIRKSIADGLEKFGQEEKPYGEKKPTSH